VSKQFTLGKNERLKSRKSIEQLFSEGKNFAVNPFRVYYLFLPLTTHIPIAIGTPFTLQFGVGVSAKFFKKAVDRNRIKRITRETYRLQKTALQDKLKEKKIRLNIFFIYTSKELTSYKEVYDKMNLILNKMIKIMDEIK
jgi:ribonuclease P protein component